MDIMDFMPQWNKDNVQDVSGIPTNDAMAQLELQRRLKMAQQLQESKNPEGQMISGHYVAPSWTQYAANAMNKYYGGKKEAEAIKGYGDYQKTQQEKLAKAVESFGKEYGPEEIKTMKDNFVTQPLEMGANVPTSPFKTNDQVAQVYPNFNGQAPMQNMQGDTTVNQPIESTTYRPRTQTEKMQALYNFGKTTQNPELLNKMVLAQAENLFKAPETNLGKVDVDKFTPASVAKFSTTQNYTDLEPINKATAPVVRTMRQGLNEVTQQWNDKTQKWDEIAKGPAFKPDAENAVFSPEVLNSMADQALAGDKSVFTGLGRGQQGAKNIVALRTAINNKMLENGWSGKDIAAKNAEFMGLMAGERTVSTKGANIEIAGNEFTNIVPIAKQASDNVSRSGFLPFGKAQIMFNEQTNNVELSKFAAANNGLVNTYARAISPTGVPTVEDKRHARQIISEAKDQSAYNAAVDTLLQEIEAAKKAPKQVRENLRSEISGNSGAGGGGKVVHWNDLQNR